MICGMCVVSNMGRAAFVQQVQLTSTIIGGALAVLPVYHRAFIEMLFNAAGYFSATNDIATNGYNHCSFAQAVLSLTGMASGMPPSSPTTFPMRLPASGGAAAVVTEVVVTIPNGLRSNVLTTAGTTVTVNNIAMMGSGDDGGGDGGEGELIIPDGVTLTDAELRAAQYLVDEGRTVEAIPRSTQDGIRTPDFLVDGIPTELKTVSNITSSDISGRIAETIRDASGQSGHIIIDGRTQSGLTQSEANRAIGRAYGADKNTRKIQSIRIIGNDFDIIAPRRD